MEKMFEKVKSNLAEHLLKIDLGKLSMMELTSYATMVVQLNPLYEKKKTMRRRWRKYYPAIATVCAFPPPR